MLRDDGAFAGVAEVPDGDGEAVGAALGVVLPQVRQREVLHRCVALLLPVQLPHATRPSFETALNKNISWSCSELQNRAESREAVHG
jgi:hypothetical protein